MDSESVELLRRQIQESLDSSQMVWWEWEIQNNRVTFHPKKATQLGYEAEEFEGSGYEAFTNLLDPRDYERTMDAMRGYLEGRYPVYQIDYRIERADGNYTWYIDRGYAIEFDSDGSPTRMRGLVFDLGIDEIVAKDEATLVRAIRKALPRITGDGKTRLASVCSVCLRLKLSDKQWVPITKDLPEIIVGQVSHGLCPDCMQRLYPELVEEFSKEE